ncbi:MULTISPECIES: hypothetical protein [Paenibacillus]|uniref:Uncharacterized protein n=1 Tax=Paenibacillus albilobatus TaxID=2716884 RepID=A0A919XH14_9BACL|nr:MULTISPECIES: hypothetical protein [Paenibacillus]GIO32479.1 hypothetical protein J2TS6_36200 [Paenibacillus albilobatus]
MLYWLFERMDVFLPVFVICPLLAALIGVFCRLLRVHIAVGSGIALLLPLLFIANDLPTMMMNLDAWAMYGAIYGLIAFAVYKVSPKRVKP